MLNASALSGVMVFTVANVMGMNVGGAPDRLQGTAGFSGSTFMGYPLFLAVQNSAPLLFELITWGFELFSGIYQEFLVVNGSLGNICLKAHFVARPVWEEFWPLNAPL